MIGRRRGGARLVRRAIAGLKIDVQRIAGLVIEVLKNADRATATEVLGIAVREMATVVLVTEDPVMAIAVLATGAVLKTVGRARVDRQTVVRRPDVDLVVDSAGPARSVAPCRDLHRQRVRWPVCRIRTRVVVHLMSASLAWNTSWMRS